MLEPAPAPRKFTMADLMILVAGCALGIAWTKAAHDAWFGRLGGLGSNWRSNIPVLVNSPSPMLASIGLAPLACRLRAPRPTLRRLSRQPGVMAIACASAMLGANGILQVAGWGLGLVVSPASATSAFIISS